MKQYSKTKMLALLLAAMMSMTALSGCSDNKKPQEQSTAEQTEQTEQTEQSQTKPEETTQQSAGQTEKITLSDESGLAQFNNPDKDSEVAILHTTAGDIGVMFFPQYAPKSVENFLTHAKDGYYDGISFHRVIEDFMIQGGDPKGDGTGGSTDTIKGEFSQNGVENTLSHTRGVVSMARSNDPDSASSQFFICYGDESFLDGQYAAFGKVTEGMDVVDSFVKVERSIGSDGAVSSPNTDIIMENVKMIDDDSDGNPRVEITMNDFLK